MGLCGVRAATCESPDSLSEAPEANRAASVTHNLPFCWRSCGSAGYSVVLSINNSSVTVRTENNGHRLAWNWGNLASLQSHENRRDKVKRKKRGVVRDETRAVPAIEVQLSGATQMSS
ncbi:hypothetical protein EYF80_035779 [Liparis tanakae]|uniref:Uncharacterized protein n=1 Tax=Liparis tanakae TaxID=230148 RepID=A0A4Z2GLB5_9TELE|nr:hypothetical protein EYF80_035779 [Liparis tanakae]